MEKDSVKALISVVGKYISFLKIACFRDWIFSNSLLDETGEKDQSKTNLIQNEEEYYYDKNAKAVQAFNSGGYLQRYTLQSLL